MQTFHQLHIGDARRMSAVAEASVDLVVTSPPYPMIRMWDELFTRLAPSVAAALANGRGAETFELMHGSLDPVWAEVHRILRPGGIACINVGDALRTMSERFGLYPNHSRILDRLRRLGFQPLPLVLWRKPTNAPTKFMGSGMLPPGAYVTLEHEYILIVRKGGLRRFSSDDERRRRRESAFFWEERNCWFSDVWTDLRGSRQDLKRDGTRDRSAAFPFELAFRLVNMFSIKGDLVADPFLGTGTTLAAAAAAARNSVGWELEPQLAEAVRVSARQAPAIGEQRIRRRLQDHLEFVRLRSNAGHRFRHHSLRYGFPVMTRQETEMRIDLPVEVHAPSPASFRVDYVEVKDARAGRRLSALLTEEVPASLPSDGKTGYARNRQRSCQRSLFEK